MDAREQQLYKLQQVRSKIIQIMRTSEQQVNIVASFREQEASIQEIEKISTTGTKSKALFSFLVLMAAYAVCMAFFKSWGDLILCGVCLAIIIRNWKRKSKLKIAASVLLVVAVFDFFSSAIKLVLSGNIALGIIMALLVVLSVFCVKGIITAGNIHIDRKNASIAKKNRDIEERNFQIEHKNNELQRQYDETVQRLENLRSDLLRIGAGWYPKDYYSLNAVNFFIKAIENFKADNMKEAVLLFDNTQMMTKMYESQQTLIELQQQQIINQEAIKKELRFANVLSMQNIALGYSTLGAINSNTNAVNNASYRVIETMNQFKN